ncbi:B-4DMT family transporter [Mycobacterium sp. Marseille-P9652]|uniref:B-4DMT family transporter n=1 Tax=Mycobacterium sp. Marseille-P9652 TaxID=2654950 RepID=UPI0012E7BD9C|nr:B-4DMT family transporter [Mycobacterium sp. Marseille-P9652]
MNKWLLRGLVYAAAMVVVRLIQGALINAWQTQAGLISVVLLVLFVIGVVIWGVIDGRADARAQPDPDRRQDLAMIWLLAGLVAGVLSGLICWLIRLFYQALYTGGLLNEVTTFAAFTALLVFLPAIIGVTVGRWRVDRKPDSGRSKREAGEERADTDVFSAVRGDDAPTGEIPTQGGAAQHEQQTSSVATAERPTEHEHEREARTETIPTTEAHTETIPTSEDAKTEVIRTDRHPRPEGETN